MAARHPQRFIFLNPAFVFDPLQPTKQYGKANSPRPSRPVIVAPRLDTEVIKLQRASIALRGDGKRTDARRNWRPIPAR